MHPKLEINKYLVELSKAVWYNAHPNKKKGGFCMKLIFDGNPIQTTPGASLLQLIQQLGMDGTTLLDRPLAAKIAGEIGRAHV